MWGDEEKNRSGGDQSPGNNYIQKSGATSENLGIVNRSHQVHFNRCAVFQEISRILNAHNFEISARSLERTRNVPRFTGSK